MVDFMSFSSKILNQVKTVAVKFTFNFQEIIAMSA